MCSMHWLWIRMSNMWLLCNSIIQCNKTCYSCSIGINATILHPSHENWCIILSVSLVILININVPFVDILLIGKHTLRSTWIMSIQEQIWKVCICYKYRERSQEHIDFTHLKSSRQKFGFVAARLKILKVYKEKIHIIYIKLLD